MHIISKQGSTDNVLTYEHICDTSADMAKIDRKYITLGSVCIILAGASGAMEVYMADSNKEWHDILAGASSGGSAPSGLTLHICTQNEVSNGKPNIEFPLETELYLVPSGAESGNLYDEYIWVNDAWELFGGANIDLTGYATQAWVSQQGYLSSFIETDPTVPAWAKASQKPTYTAQEVGALPADTPIPTVPTNISAFINDVNYLSNPEATTIVENWLESNITSGNVIDTSLTIEGASADAKKTGDEISNLKSALSDLEDDLEKVYTGIPVIITDTVNKLNVKTLSLNTNITTTGEEVARNNTDASAFIPVVSGKTYVVFTGKNAARTARVSLPIDRLLFYNSDETVISYKDNTSSNTVHEIPANTAFVRICVAHNDYITSRQPMVEFVNALSEISSTYVPYEEITVYSHGINYLDETQQDILERLGEVEDALTPLSSQVETNTGNIATLQSNVNDILGEAKAISVLGTFARGGINSSTGAYNDYYQYRVATPDIITIPKDYTVSIAEGFRLYVATFVNNVLADKGWKTEGYKLDKDATVRLMIARQTEDSSEAANVDTFCSKVTIRAVSSMNGYQEQIDENAKNIANIDAVIPYGLTWDWWITANGVDSFGNVYIGYVDTDEYAGILRRQPDGVMQYKRLERSYNDDDHNGLATIVLSDGRILAIGSHGHSASNHIICYRSAQPNSIDNMEKLSFDIPQGSTYVYHTTYSQIFEYNGVLFDFMRCTILATGVESVTGYLCLISSDSGDTWTAYQLLQFGDPYVAFAQCTDDEKYLKMVLGVNPASGSYTFKGGVIDLSTYKIYDLNNTEIGQMIPLGTGTYDASTIANPADMTDLIAQTENGKKGRLFTTARTAKAKTVFLYATAIDSASSDFTYKVFDDGTVTEIGMSGTPFGNVHYISGPCFGKDVDTIYYAKATTAKADGPHELHKVKIENNTVSEDTIITESSMCILRPLFLGNGELATVVGHYNDQNSDGTYNGSFTDWELKPLFTHA